MDEIDEAIKSAAERSRQLLQRQWLRETDELIWRLTSPEYERFLRKFSKLQADRIAKSWGAKVF